MPVKTGGSRSGTPVKMSGMTLSRKLQALLDQRDWKQADLLRAVTRATGRYISRTSLSEWVNGPGKPDMERMLLLAKGLRVPMEFLADDDASELPEIGLDADETTVLRMAKVLGPDEAIRRLTAAPKTPTLSLDLVQMNDEKSDPDIDDERKRAERKAIQTALKAKQAELREEQARGTANSAATEGAGKVEPGRAGHNLGTTGDVAIREASLVPPPKKPPEKPKPTPGERENDQRKPGTKRRKDGE